MKSNLYKLVVVLALSTSSVLITSCGESANTNQTETAQATYACPMDCENGKTYSDEGICPVCEMDLKEVEQ